MLVRNSQILCKTDVRYNLFSSEIFNNGISIKNGDLLKDFYATYQYIEGQKAYTVELELIASRWLIKEIYDC